MDVSQALKDAENSLRDFIASTLTSSMGDDWINSVGIAPEKIDKWKTRKTEEEKKQRTGVAEERLIYYADFYDLQTILKKRWSQDFQAVFVKWKELEVWLDALNNLRDAEAHRRELLPHQKHLILGVSGEIRSMIVRYRSKMDTGDDYFPRIESARDSLGHMATEASAGTVYTEATIRVGDQLDFVITASDPQGEELEYCLSPGSMDILGWQKANTLSAVVTEAMIRKHSEFSIYIRSPRRHHACGLFDDVVAFVYCVLPAK